MCPEQKIKLDRSKNFLGLCGRDKYPHPDTNTRAVGGYPDGAVGQEEKDLRGLG